MAPEIDRGLSATNGQASSGINSSTALANGNSRVHQANAFVATNWAERKKNTLLGFFNLALPSGLIIAGCSLHERDGKRWVALPGRPYQKPDGTTSYVAVLDFTSSQAKYRFQDAALRAVDALLQEVQL